MLLFLYNLFFPIAILLVFPVYLRRMLRRGGYGRNFAQRFGFYSRRLRETLSRGEWTWVRAVSVGEIMMAIRLLEALKREAPDLRAVISTTTSTGYKIGLEQSETRKWIEVVYSPIDFYPIIQSCWKKVRPRRVILIDSDLWPSFLAVATEYQTPVFLANARLSPRSARRYRNARWLARLLFWDRLSKLFAQDQRDAERWQQAGVSADRIRVLGSMKYDTEDGGKPSPRFLHWLKENRADPTRPILLGGSLHPGEEELLLSSLRELQDQRLFLVLVPRHAERTPEIERLLQKQGISYTLRSAPHFEPDTSVLVVDSTGELRDWYFVATIVVIGKSFCGLGGQNPVEPILARKPVIAGPHMENFQFLVDELRKENGILQLESSKPLTDSVARLLTNPSERDQLVANASKALEQHRGAVGRTAKAILSFGSGSLVPSSEFRADGPADGGR
jgi:3-deoxy-D-manno-octulosonic-acid transferase